MGYPLILEETNAAEPISEGVIARGDDGTTMAGWQILRLSRIR